LDWTETLSPVLPSSTSALIAISTISTLTGARIRKSESPDFRLEGASDNRIGELLF
jgi:hypothetical protein